MSLMCYMRLREYGTKGLGSATVPSVVDRVECRRSDVHHIEAQEFGECTPPLTCRFSKLVPKTLAVADEDGGILILDTDKQGIDAVQQDWLAHKNAVFDVDWMPQENKLLTASGDQTVVLWDVEVEEKTGIFRGHSSSVKTARFAPDNKNLFVTGARDGHVLLYDTRVTEKDGHIPPVNILRNAHHCVPTGSAHKKRKVNQQETPQSVTAVVFQDDNTLVSSGSVDGSIKVWDLRKNYTSLKMEPVPKHTFLYSGTSVRTHGFSCLTFNASRTSLFASCMDNNIYQYDTVAFTKRPVAYYQGHKNTTFYVKTALSPDEQYLLSGSSDNSAYIWSVNEPAAQPWTLEGHDGEVSAVDWCTRDVGKVATVSDDSTIRIWRLGREQTDTPPGYGISDITGHAHRPRNKSVSVKASDLSILSGIPQKKVCVTPKKGNVVAKSPVKMSSVVRKSLLDLAKSTGSSKSSIQNWFSVGQNKTVKQSPLKKTPRKLLITPKKQQVDPQFSASQPSDLTTLSQSSSCSVKRKLYDESSLVNKSKRQRLEDNYFSGHVQDENSCDGYIPKLASSCADIATGGVLTESVAENWTGEDTQNSIDSLKDIVTPVKGSTPVQYRSPTVNLPSYVFDPVPRTPIARTPSGAKTPSTPNWLTKMRLDRSMSASKLQSSIETTPKGASAIPSELRSSKTTPRRKKGTLKRRGSISQYFSPDANIKKQQKPP